jgi:hypothetical protein
MGNCVAKTPTERVVPTEGTPNASSSVSSPSLPSGADRVSVERASAERVADADRVALAEAERVKAADSDWVTYG